MIEIRHESELSQLQASYDQIYAQKTIARDTMTYRWLLDQLNPTPGSKLLDVACGDGSILKQALKHTTSIWGADFSNQAINLAKVNVSSAKFAVANGEYLPYCDNSFDYVTNIGSLEHYQNMEWGCQEMARVLKPTGQAMILLPNLFGMLWNVQHVKHTGDVCDDGQPLQRYATPGEWHRLLEANGFIIEKMLPYGWAWPKGWREWLYYLKQPKLLMILFVWQPRHFPNLANTLVYICKKQV